MSTEKPMKNPPDEGLDRARSKRNDLLDAMRSLEEAAARPAADSSGWLASVREAVDVLGEALRRHIEEAESPDGMVEDIIREEPRLAAAVAQLRDEHPELVTAWQRTKEAVDDPLTDRNRIRRRIVALLGRLALHRQGGADLVYEAYSVDIGGRG